MKNLTTKIQGTLESIFPQMKVDVVEENDRYMVEVELPGYKKEEIKLSIEYGILSVVASHVEESEETETKPEYTYIVKERSSGKITRNISLPKASHEGITSSFEDGILKITVPKAENRQTQDIKID